MVDGLGVRVKGLGLYTCIKYVNIYTLCDEDDVFYLFLQ
jgi:hypothetical protein